MPIDSYNDTSTAEVPAHTGAKTKSQSAEHSASAKGRPSAVKESDGTENLRADQKTKQAANLSTPSGSKGNAPVTRYNDRGV